MGPLVGCLELFARENSCSCKRVGIVGEAKHFYTLCKGKSMLPEDGGKALQTPRRPSNKRKVTTQVSVQRKKVDQARFEKSKVFWERRERREERKD